MLTPSGRAVCVLAVVLLVAGALLDYPELVAIGLACLLAVLLAACWMLLRPKLEAVRQIDPVRVEAGGSAQGTLTLKNLGGRRSPPVIAVEQVAGEFVRVSLPSLRQQEVCRQEYPLPTDRRGVFTIGPLRIGHSDPLRLMFSDIKVSSKAELTVYPRTHVVSPLPTGQARDADGPTSSDSPRGGDVFHMMREYVPGDDPRLIHWRSSAKTGTLVVRYNVAPNEPRLMVVLDTSPAPYDTGPGGDETFEDAVRVAASLCIATCDAGYPLTFRTTGGTSAQFERGTVGRGDLLDTLAKVQRQDSDPGLRCLQELASGRDPISLGVVTGQAPEDQRAAVRAVRHKFRTVTLVQVGERFGRPAASDGGVFTVNAGTSEDFAAIWNQRVRR